MGAGQGHVPAYDVILSESAIFEHSTIIIILSVEIFPCGFCIQK